MDPLLLLVVVLLVLIWALGMGTAYTVGGGLIHALVLVATDELGLLAEVLESCPSPRRFVASIARISSSTNVCRAMRYLLRPSYR